MSRPESCEEGVVEGTARSCVAVTGASGFLGQAVVAALPGAVRALVRRPWSPPRAEVEVVRGDLGDPVSLASLVRGCDVVIHAAALMNSADDEALRRVQVQGTRALLRAASEASVGRFVLVSSVAAGRPGHGPYSRSKRAAEQLVRGWGIPFVILRPTLLVGPGSQLERTLAGLQRLPVVPVVGRASLRPLHVDAAAQACVGAALADVEGTFDLVGPDCVSLASLARRITGRPAVALPARLCAAVAALGERAGIPLPLTLEGVRAASTDLRHLDPGPAAAALGFTPRGLA